MAWDGYFTVDQDELINSARTEQLAGHKPWFRPIYDNNILPLMLGDSPEFYGDVTTAPWYDPDNPASSRFFGIYPLGVVGIEDSSRTSAVVESTEDGGVAGRIRHGIKSVVFNVLLIADDAEAADYGMQWLKRALLGSVCSPLLTTDHVLGVQLGYLASPPVREPNPAIGQQIQVRDIGRTLRRVVFNSGPSVLAKFDNLTCGGSAWNVQFTAVVGVPYEFGLEQAIIQGYMDPEVTDPWVPGVTPGPYSTTPEPFVEVECGDNLWDPLYDPLCAALIVPPGPPSVPLGCYQPVSQWSRRMITIPADNIPLWGEVVPIIELSTTPEVRNVRLRFYKDPDGTFDPDDYPCDFVGDVVVSYIPAGGSIVLDGTTREVVVNTVSNQRRRADSLVFRTDGKPLEWPSLTCGYQYIVTVDLPDGSALPVLDLSLVHRMK